MYYLLRVCKFYNRVILLLYDYAFFLFQESCYNISSKYLSLRRYNTRIKTQQTIRNTIFFLEYNYHIDMAISIIIIVREKRLSI